MTGENSRAWKGDKAGYVAIHTWLRNTYGKASRCESPNCESKSPKRYEYANLSGEYKRDRSDYIQLCPSCHRKMDMSPELIAKVSKNLKPYAPGQTHTKLQEEDAVEIKRLYRDGGLDQYALANRYGVDQSLISRIVNNKIWKRTLVR